jgi:pimeloyl-ACP methyl ester carboxylesterase
VPIVQANNCEMYYEVDDYTDPWLKQTDTVLLQHGVGRSSRFWYHWVPALAGRYRVVRRDLRGHGQSSDPGREHKWSIDELIDDMKSFLDALELDRVHYVGESIGGILGVVFAAKWPERLKSLTVCSTPTSIRASARKALTGGDRELTSELGKVGGGGWVKILIEQKVISGKQRKRSGAHRLGRARMVQNTDARAARDYAHASRRRYHSALVASEGADAGYRAVAQSVNVAGRSDHDSQLDSGRTDCGG